MQELINMYNTSLKKLKESRDTATDEDKVVLSSMISDLTYALEWMRTAKQPGTRRGIERRASYQREVPVSPLLMQRYFRNSYEDSYRWDNQLKEDVITVTEREMIEDALSVLTEKEKEVYLMSRGYCLSYDRIASYLDIQKSTVQTMVERAEKKIARRKYESLFCFAV